VLGLLRELDCSCGVKWRATTAAIELAEQAEHHEA